MDLLIISIKVLLVVMQRQCCSKYPYASYRITFTTMGVAEDRLFPSGKLFHLDTICTQYVIVLILYTVKVCNCSHSGIFISMAATDTIEKAKS